MPCGFCQQARRMLARVLLGRPPEPAPPLVPRQRSSWPHAGFAVPPRVPTLVLRCCDPRHPTRMIERNALVSATYNLGTPELNEAAARADGWERRSEGWICGACATRR